MYFLGPVAKELSPKLFAHFYCQKDQESKGLASYFVNDLINQLAQKFGFEKSNFEKCCDNPSEAFRSDFLQPLIALRLQKDQQNVSTDYYVIAVDALENAEYFPTEQTQSIARFLETHSSIMPNWIKVILTVRQDRVEVVKEMPFQKIR